MKGIVSIFFILLSMTSFSNEHKYYVSMTEIVHDAEKKEILVNVRVFLDDLQKAVYLDEGVEIDDPLAKYETEFMRYFGRHMKITVNGKLQQLEFVETEDDADAVVFRLKISDAPDEISELKVKCSLMIAVLPDQTNIINYFASGSKKARGLFLNRKKQEGQVKL